MLQFVPVKDSSAESVNELAEVMKRSVAELLQLVRGQSETVARRPAATYERRTLGSPGADQPRTVWRPSAAAGVATARTTPARNRPQRQYAGGRFHGKAIGNRCRQRADSVSFMRRLGRETESQVSIGRAAVWLKHN